MEAKEGNSKETIPMPPFPCRRAFGFCNWVLAIFDSDLRLAIVYSRLADRDRSVPLSPLAPVPSESSALKPASVTIRVPATSGNLGPGFDTLGLALKLYNFVRLTRAPGKAVELVSPIAPGVRTAATAMLAAAADLFFQRMGKARFGFEVSLRGDVPVARGLGSSVTARLGVVAGLNELTRAKLTREQLLNIVTELEHHPDNAAPAIFGGFTVAGMVNGEARCLAFPVSPRVKFVTLIPRFEISTEQARTLVPQTFSKSDTVQNLSRVAFLSAALASGNYGTLRGWFDDRIHQPYREKLIPQLSRVIRAGEKAGAVGGWLSGSGSTIMCLTLANTRAVARAMQRHLPDSDVKILTADAKGFQVL
jgi:homoserine kinase